MLSPGDEVFLDGNHVPRERWTVSVAGSVDGRVYYQFEGWPDPDEWVPASRITAHWVET
jgi:hypothetical protein